MLVSEELGTAPSEPGGRATVVVDPIDGSVNAKRGIPFFSFSLAVADGRRWATSSFGYVYDFGTGEEWTAERGGGAFLNGSAARRRSGRRSAIEILSFEGTTTPAIADRVGARRSSSRIGCA